MVYVDDRMPVQRTEKGLKYEKYFKAVKGIVNNAADESVVAANEAILELREKGTRPDEVHQDEVLTNLSVMYANDDYIGERLMPVVFTGGQLSGVYFEYNKRDRFAYPDDSMKDRTDANEISQGRTKQNYSLESRALREYLDQLTLQNQSAPLNEMIDVQQNVLEAMAFKREQRHSALLCAAASYGSNTEALAAGDRFDVDGVDPGKIVDDAMASLWRGRGPGRIAAFTSLNVHNKLKRNPMILDQFKGAGKRPGFASIEMLREYFEVDEYIVGKAREDVANEGQTANYTRLWDDVFGLVRVATNPTLRNAAFGYTLQDMPSETSILWDGHKSVKGAWDVKCSHSDENKIIAPDTGFLLRTVIN